MDALTLATFGLVSATLLLALVTAGLYWESRRIRVEANLVAYAAPWEIAYGLYPAILVENAGPAVARDVTVTRTLTRPAGIADGVLREPAFPIGFRRTILPAKGPKLDELAEGRRGDLDRASLARRPPGPTTRAVVRFRGHPTTSCRCRFGTPCARSATSCPDSCCA